MSTDITQAVPCTSKQLGGHAEAASQLEDVQPTAEYVAQDAVDETGFGRFNIKVMIICSLIFLNVAFSLTSIGFILPSAACDFKMTTTDKGKLSAAPIVGMLCGSYVWGCYAAIKGRKHALLFSLFLHGSSEFLASVTPIYWVFFFLGEFQPTIYRDRMLAWMEIAWASGILFMSTIAWLIIPLNIHLEASGFVFHSWNLFVLTCSLLSILVGAWLLTFPETPKYLADTGQNAKMIKVLMKMYSENSGHPSKEYIAKLQVSGNEHLVEFVNRATSTAAEKPIRRSVRTMLREILANTVAVVKPPFLSRTILICLISGLMMSSYYTLTLWLPELFHRFANFEASHPNTSASVCTLRSARNLTNEFEESNCGTVEQSVFIDSFILSASCIPAGLLLPVLITFMGYKRLLVIGIIIPGVVTMCLFLVNTSTENLILSCIFEAVTSVCISIIYCLLVDLYPTHLRAMASGLAAFLSRIGAISGNLLMGFLIDDYCIELIIIIAAQLLISGILAMFIPGSRKLKEEENPREADKF